MLMIRQIIKIDTEKCNGCGICVDACKEEAIKMVDGKAKLIRDDYCDGLGNCLPVCPTGAITFEEREAKPFDEEAVKLMACGCPGTMAKEIIRESSEIRPLQADSTAVTSQLKQWPVQIKLVPSQAPYFENAHLLVAADCTAYACGDFHFKFMKNKVTVIGCPKLDQEDYTSKLEAIIRNNSIQSVTIIRMEVPCCAGIVQAASQALQNSGKFIPWSVVTIGTDGTIKE